MDNATGEKIAQGLTTLAEALRGIGRNGQGVIKTQLYGQDSSGLPAPISLSALGGVKVSILSEGAERLIGQGILTGSLATFFTSAVAYKAARLVLSNIVPDENNGGAEYFTAEWYHVKSGGTATNPEAKYAKLYSGEGEEYAIGLQAGDTLQGLCSRSGSIAWNLYGEIA